MRPEGFGFVLVDGGPDLFVPRSGMHGAMDGDTVLAREERPRSRGRSEAADRISGTVVRILDRARERVVGRFEKHDGRAQVFPYDPRIDAIVRIADGKTHGAREGEIVEARITAFPDARRIAHGVVEERLGFLGEPGVDVEIVLRSHGLPPRFPQPVVEEAERFPSRVLTEDLLGRRDFRDRRIVTIDGETAKDFDDAVEVEKTPTGFRLGVHIADVSHYVQEGTLLDDEARSRGTSVYFPGRVLPMLPEKLSNGLCSLNPRRGPARPLRDPRDRPEGPGRQLRVRQGRHSQRRADDLHGGRAAAGRKTVARRRGPVWSAPGGLPRHGGARGPTARTPRRARLDRLRPSGRGRRARRRGARRRHRSGVAQRRPPPDRRVHARGERGRCEEAPLRETARDLPRPRPPGPGPPGGRARSPSELRVRPEGRPRGGSLLGVPESSEGDRGKARGAAPVGPAPARAAQGCLQPGVPRALRARGALLLPLHVADPAVPGPDRPPPALARSSKRAARLRRRTSRRSTRGWGRSRRTPPSASAARRRPSGRASSGRRSSS